MAEKFREVTGKKRPTRNTIIKDANGTPLTDRNEVLKDGKNMLANYVVK